MNCHVVTDGNIVAYFNSRFLIERVQHRAVLNVHAVANGDGVHVATQHGAKPDAALVAHRHIAYDSGVVGKEAVIAEFGSESSY